MFQVLGNVHDIESYLDVTNVLALDARLFLCHWGHLAIIFMWVSGTLFHIGWSGNYGLWVMNPVKVSPIAHGIWDPHFGIASRDAYSFGYSSSDYAAVVSYAGVYNWLYTVGFSSVSQINNFVIAVELLAVAAMVLAKLHLVYVDAKLHWVSSMGSPSFIWIPRVLVSCFDLSGLRVNFHIGVLIGYTCIAWSGHLVYVALHWAPNWEQGSNSLTQLCSLLTFEGGLQPDTCSLYCTDLAHHHLAVGILFVLAAHLYASVYKGVGIRLSDALKLNGNSGSTISELAKSLHVQLSLACAGLGVCTSVVAQHMYSLTPYAYISYDYVTTVSLYVHHQYIASLLMMAAFAHATIFFIRDYTLQRSASEDPIARIISHKSGILSHLSWVCLYVGFHTLGLYVHNDTVVAFGESGKQILIEPILGQIIQEASAVILPIGPGDLLVHHAIALGLHVTVLILLKGCLDSRGSRLMVDKVNFGYGFACDGPTRGGTCDVSAWDSFYLAMFWMLNTDAWLMFYFHWKHITLWQGTAFQFYESSTYLNGWFRDYLWFNSACLINGYNAFGSNDLSAVSWLFLGAHLCWATGFMFLISWRGYWQELIDSILYMHFKTPFLYDLWFGQVTPTALSIVQARFIGIVHFSVGFIGTYSSFVIGATS